MNTQYQLKSSEWQTDMLALRGLFNSSKKLSLRFTRYIVLLNQLMQKSDKPLDKKVLAVFFEQSEKFFDESKDYLDNYNSATPHAKQDTGKQYLCNFLNWLCFFYYKGQNIGTDKDDEDERDEFIAVKTDHQMYKIANWLICILGLAFLIWVAFAYKCEGLTIAGTLSILWNILLLIGMIGITNELRS